MSVLPVSGPGNPSTHRGSGGRAQIARLFRLILFLQTDRFPNALRLAERCEVSRRTIYRDLEVLAAAGIPVRYQPERQGYQLPDDFFLRPTSLLETEALALLVLSRQWPGGDGLGLLCHARRGAVKLVQGLPTGPRERVLSAAEPFPDAADSPGPSLERQILCDAVLGALPARRQLRVWYRATGTLTQECTKFSLYRLLLHDRRWFMVGRSSLHRRVKVFGVASVQSVVLTDDPYTVPPRFDLGRFLGQAWAVEPHNVPHRVRLRFKAGVAPELDEAVWHRSQKCEGLSDGRLELEFVVDGLEEVLRWVLGFGDQVEVLAPDLLRDQLREVAVRVVRTHGGGNAGVPSRPEYVNPP